VRKDRKKKARREGKRDNKLGEKEGRKGGREGSERREREPFLRLAVSAQSGLGVNSAASSSIFLAVGFFASETASTVLCSGAETASKLFSANFERSNTPSSVQGLLLPPVPMSAGNGGGEWRDRPVVGRGRFLLVGRALPSSAVGSSAVMLAVMLAAMALVLAAKSITATPLVLALVLEPVLVLESVLFPCR
jgi:hypothetical protein